jgi:3-keto-disaccharide hydrolase
MSANVKRTRVTNMVAIFIGFALAVGLSIYVRTSAVGQPSARQSQSPPVKLRADGMPVNFPFREPNPMNFNDRTGYVSLFDGKDLKGWDGDPSVWSVKDGDIVGVSTKANPKHSYLVYRRLLAKNFDLKVVAKVTEGGGTGIQYRSKAGLPWHGKGKPPVSNLNWWMTGPQFDFWFPVNPSASVFTGQLYSENTSLGIISWRGQAVQMTRGDTPTLVGNIGNRTALGGYDKVNDWNQFLIIARGGTIIQIMNGQLMSVLVDDNPTDSNNQTGMIGIEIESAPCKVSVRSVWIRKLP